MSDEGIGVVLVQRFLALQDQYPQVEFVDAGTGGFSLLYQIERAGKAIFIDCALMGERPGTLKRFTLEAVESVKRLSHFSLHEGDLLTLIAKARQLEQCPDEIVIFGIEPQTIDYGLTLTQILSDHLEDYVRDIARELSVQ